MKWWYPERQDWGRTRLVTRWHYNCLGAGTVDPRRPRLLEGGLCLQLASWMDTYPRAAAISAEPSIEGRGDADSRGQMQPTGPVV